MLKKIKRESKRLLAQRLGFEPFAFQLAMDALRQDVRDPGIPWARKMWAWTHGFSAEHCHTYSIDDTNCHLFVPTLAYYRMHPINGVHSQWIDDKLTVRYILAPFASYLPKYYFQISRRGCVYRLMDCPDGLQEDQGGILALLVRQGELALKPISGSLSQGFHHLTSHEGNYSIDSHGVSQQEVVNLVKGLRGYLVMEYIRAHPTVAAVYSATPNTTRVQVIRQQGGRPEISAAFIRFGTSDSGISESPSHGALISRVELHTGIVTETFALRHGMRVTTSTHPDSGQSMHLTLPHWKLVRSVLLEISDYLPQLEWVGYDVVITADSFRILELNSLTAPGWIQFFYPPLGTPTGRAFFTEKLRRRAVVTNP